MTWLQHTYATDLSERMYSVQSPEEVSNPSMILYNQALAKELGIAKHLTDQAKATAILSGNEVLPNSKAIAQAYAGHQFGHFNRLGDGRAVLLGEVKTDKGLYDIQLKGSGQTVYSRRGDGRATLYSMLREYLISEAMFALSIPTTRSLSVIKTTDPVYREQIHEGGVLSRVAASHIRVGTFEFARYFAERKDLESLLYHTIQRHYPELEDAENRALALLEAVMKAQKSLVIDWMRVGFIHGVMNTDNVSISGETIDYGPCAFMNNYDPQTVFSSIDKQGRYAFANQPNIAFWNLKVFANAILPLIDEDEEKAKQKAESVLNEFPKEFREDYLEMMTNKLGIENYVETDRELVDECLALLSKYDVDFTNFFTYLRRGGEFIDKLNREDDFNAWFLNWETARLRDSNIESSNALMKKNNPVVIPRNHKVEEVLQSAISGEMEPFNTFLEELAFPYSDAPSIQAVPEDFDACYQTFCGT